MFQRFLNTVARFMQGRYGSDRFNRFLLILYFILWLIAGWFRRATWGWVFSIVLWGILALLLFRTFSRNIPRRQAEEAWFLRWWGPVGAWLSRQWMRLRDIRRCRYRTCPRCKAQLRLPIKRGRRTVTCHCCRTQFKTFFL